MEIRTDKLKSVATALASGVSSLFGSGKMKSLERRNEDLQDEIVIRNETIEQLQSVIRQIPTISQTTYPTPKEQRNEPVTAMATQS